MGFFTATINKAFAKIMATIGFPSYSSSSPYTPLDLKYTDTLFGSQKVTIWVDMTNYTIALPSDPTTPSGLTGAPQRTAKVWACYLDQQTAMSLARYLDMVLRAFPQHREVVNDKNWQAMYCVSKTTTAAFPKMDSEGNITQSAYLWNVPLVPCHNCGFCWPLSSIQVDHYIPEADTNRFALLKALRYCGLTKHSQTGKKAEYLHSLHDGSPIETRMPIYPHQNPPGQFSFNNPFRDATKTVLSPEGWIFASLLLIGHGSNNLNGVDNYCKNLICNLVPLCGPCNRNKTDHVKPVKPPE